MSSQFVTISGMWCWPGCRKWVTWGFPRKALPCPQHLLSPCSPVITTLAALFTLSFSTWCLASLQAHSNKPKPGSKINSSYSSLLALLIWHSPESSDRESQLTNYLDQIDPWLYLWRLSWFLVDVRGPGHCGCLYYLGSWFRTVQAEGCELASQ